MNEIQPLTHADFTLPPNIISRVDVSRLVREIERVDNQLTSAAVHAKVDSAEVAPPVLSEECTDFLQQNSLTLDNGHDRAELIKQLRLLKDKVPVIHMTFAVVADRESLGQITQWLRTTIHPQAVVSVGIQPALVAGVYLRTPNHVHDLSLRAALKGGRNVLIKELGALRGSS